MDPTRAARQLRDLADTLESGTGNVRWLCCVFCQEHESPALPPGAGMIRMSRNDASPAELADAMQEAAGLVGRHVIPAG